MKIVLLLPLPLQALAQTDTTAFSSGLRPLSQHERALKAEWDALLRKGFDASKGLPNRIARENVFQYEYLVRLGVASASTSVGRNIQEADGRRRPVAVQPGWYPRNKAGTDR